MQIHVLLPTDFSENASSAALYALQLFKKSECTFYYLHSLAYLNNTTRTYITSTHVKSRKEEASRQLADLKQNSEQENTNNKHRFETILTDATLKKAVSNAVDHSGIDVIVMGTRGATGAKEVLFGSNTVKVFKYSKCPVLAVPANFEYETPHEILFPTDLNVEFKSSQLNILIELVRKSHGRVNAMHVSEKTKLSDKQENNKKELKILFKDVAFLFHDIKTMELLHAIEKFQIKHKINLLVMIKNKHSFLENLFYKNTINNIVFHLTIPFLVIPINNDAEFGRP